MSYNPQTGLGKCKDGKTIKPLPENSIIGWTRWSAWLQCQCGNQVKMDIVASTHYWRTCECGREYFVDVSFRVKEFWN